MGILVYYGQCRIYTINRIRFTEYGCITHYIGSYTLHSIHRPLSSSFYFGITL